MYMDVHGMLPIVHAMNLCCYVTIIICIPIIAGVIAPTDISTNHCRGFHYVVGLLWVSYCILDELGMLAS